MKKMGVMAYHDAPSKRPHLKAFQLEVADIPSLGHNPSHYYIINYYSVYYKAARPVVSELLFIVIFFSLSFFDFNFRVAVH